MDPGQYPQACQTLGTGGLNRARGCAAPCDIHDSRSKVFPRLVAFSVRVYPSYWPPVFRSDPPHAPAFAATFTPAAIAAGLVAATFAPAFHAATVGAGFDRAAFATAATVATAFTALARTTAFGATAVDCVDASARAVAGIRANIELNGMGDRVQAHAADAFEFLKAARAERRYKQLLEKGFSASLPALVEDIRARDSRDINRPIAPLKAADDAIVLDSTQLGIEAVMERVLREVGQLPELKRFLKSGAAS